MLFPNHCSVKEKGFDCLNPPEFVISVSVKESEYMVGVTCNKHKNSVSQKIQNLQEENKIPKGQVKFSSLKSVGTDCVKGNPDDLIQL